MRAFCVESRRVLCVFQIGLISLVLRTHFMLIGGAGFLPVM